ncbi:MAG: type IV secretion system DNA-binding domain-containing protein [bacterium]|nr:type IV secretion system DNA-binding domain-containing protein [bacterium]
MNIYLILGIAAAFFIVFVLFLIFKNLRQKRLAQALNLKLLLIRLSQKQLKDFSSEGKSGSDWKDEINLSAQLFGILAGLKSPFVFETAVHHIGEEIHFYCAVPRESIEFVSRQIEGLWEEASIEPIDDYNIFNSAAGAATSGVYLKQKLFYALPIRAYVEANIDTFSPLLSGLSKINEIGEGAAIQLLIRPAPLSAKKSILQMIDNLKKGAKIDDILKANSLKFKDIKKAVNPEKEKLERVIDDESIKALELKISKPLLSVNLRVLVSSASQYQTDAILESIVGGFSQFSAPRRNELKIIKPRNPKNLIYQFSFREFDDSQSMILNTEELASLFHLPSSSTEIPKIKWLKSKEAVSPLNLPKSGILIGETSFRGERKPVYLTEDDRRRHIYIIGQTGTGKSTLMTNMVVDDIKNGKGVAIIDPHGDLIEKILGVIPEERGDDVIIFDPSDIRRPLGMNMLEYDFNKPEEKTFIVNEMFNILDKLYDMKTVGGPMFEQYTKNAILLLMEDAINELATLMDIPRVFTDVDFRNEKLSRIKNPVVIDFWEKEAAKATGEHSLANMAPYITSKFNNFIANDYVRPIISQTKSAFDFRKVMDEGKILLVNLSKGKIGDINANLLGMIITGKILMAALSRVDTPEDQRRDFNLYIDEFQNFTTDSISTILSEARKYRLSLIMAHQFIAQLTEKIRDAVFGNVGSIISFRVGPTDAEFLVKQFAPVFNENDLVNIDNFNAYAKILINGQTSKPFNIKTLLPEKGNKEIGDKIKELSRLKYGSKI